ncbi:carboxypeptidase regulatory-like domain-containing protein [Paenibacillaceae bacterium]|nr:carboxypeptidase regulatory-like domain-containing protein [Paenibacillaceae bacterium]
MVKKLIVSITLIAFLFSLNINNTFAEVKYNIYLNGHKQNISSVAVKNDIVYFNPEEMLYYLSSYVNDNSDIVRYEIGKNKLKVNYRPKDNSYSFNNKKHYIDSDVRKKFPNKNLISSKVFSEMTGLKINISNKHKMINFGNYIPWESGNIKGRITYKSGWIIKKDSPDSNAKIVLIPKKHASKKIKFDGIDWKDGLEVYATKANENGDYQISNVAAGEYYLLILSSIYSSTNQDTSDINFMKDFIESMLTLREQCRDHKHVVTSITIKKGKTQKFNQKF